jgi:hypothetical protein
MIFGIKEETVSPYKEDMSNCFRFNVTESILIFKTRMAVTKPKLKIQKAKLMAVSREWDFRKTKIDCNQ